MQVEVNQEDSEQNEVDGMKKGAGRIGRCSVSSYWRSSQALHVPISDRGEQTRSPSLPATLRVVGPKYYYFFYRELSAKCSYTVDYISEFLPVSHDSGSDQCWNWPKRTGGSAAEMLEILPRDWNLKSIFTQKWAYVDMNWGGGSTPNPPTPRQFQPWFWYVQTSKWAISRMKHHWWQEDWSCQGHPRSLTIITQHYVLWVTSPGYITRFTHTITKKSVIGLITLRQSVSLTTQQLSRTIRWRLCGHT